MPYIPQEERDALEKDPVIFPLASGQANYLITQAILKDFLAEPRYQTIADIRAGKAAHTMTELDRLEKLGLPASEMFVAFDLAFMEFYSRVGVPYENLARAKNGDLQLYKEVGKVLHDKAMEVAIKYIPGEKK